MPFISAQVCYRRVVFATPRLVIEGIFRGNAFIFERGIPLGRIMESLFSVAICPVFNGHSQLVFCLRDAPLYRIFGAFHAFARRPMIVGGIVERELYVIVADIQPAVVFRTVKAALFGGYYGIYCFTLIFKRRIVERGQRHFRRIYGERLFSRGVIFIVGKAGDDQPYIICAGGSGHILGYCAAACILILPCERYSAALTRGRKVEGAVAPHALRRFGRHGLILVYFSSIIPFVFGQHKIGINYFRPGDGKGICNAEYCCIRIVRVITIFISGNCPGRNILIPVTGFCSERNLIITRTRCAESCSAVLSGSHSLRRNR